jgi:DNA-binding MarR family transcriptional regulator
VTPAADAAPDLGILLTLSLRAFTDQLHAALREQGFGDLRPAFGVVFRALRDEPLTLTQLAAQLRVTKQAAAKVVGEMEAKRLVLKRPSGADGRAKLLELTARGRQAMTVAITIGGQINERLIDAVGSRATRGLRLALEQLIADSGLGEDLARHRSPAV